MRPRIKRQWTIQDTGLSNHVVNLLHKGASPEAIMARYNIPQKHLRLLQSVKSAAVKSLLDTRDVKQTASMTGLPETVVQQMYRRMFSPVLRTNAAQTSDHPQALQQPGTSHASQLKTGTPRKGLAGYVSITDIIEIAKQREITINRARINSRIQCGKLSPDIGKNRGSTFLFRNERIDKIIEELSKTHHGRRTRTPEYVTVPQIVKIAQQKGVMLTVDKLRRLINSGKLVPDIIGKGKKGSGHLFKRERADNVIAVVPLGSEPGFRQALRLEGHITIPDIVKEAQRRGIKINIDGFRKKVHSGQIKADGTANLPRPMPVFREDRMDELINSAKTKQRSKRPAGQAIKTGARKKPRQETRAPSTEPRYRTDEELLRIAQTMDPKMTLSILHNMLLRNPIIKTAHGLRVYQERRAGRDVLLVPHNKFDAVVKALNRVLLKQR